MMDNVHSLSTPYSVPNNPAGGKKAGPEPKIEKKIKRDSKYENNPKWFVWLWFKKLNLFFKMKF